MALLTIDNPEECRFYEIEAAANNWSVRELETAIIDRLESFLLVLGKWTEVGVIPVEWKAFPRL